MNQKRFTLIFIFLTAALLGQVSAWAQEGFTFTDFSSHDGIPHNNVRSVAQDSTGFLWFSTWDGLSRYDGYTFKNYYHNPDDQTSIPYFSLLRIVVDRYNNVWIQSEGRSIALYDRANDCFIREKTDPDLFQRQDIAIDQNGCLWKCNVISGLWRYDYQKKEFVWVKALWDDQKAMFPLLDWSFSFTFDNHGFPWFIFSDGTQVYSCKGVPEDNHSIRFKKQRTGISKEWIQELTSIPWLDMEVLVSESGHTWFSTQIGLFRENAETGEWEKVLPPYDPDEFRGIRQEARVIDSHTLLVEITGKERREIRIPREHHFQSVFTDNNGIVWFSCIKKSGEGTGVTRAIPVPGFFRHYYPEDKKNGSTDAYFAVLKDKSGTVWTSARNRDHIYCIKPDSQVTSFLRISEEMQRKFFHPRSFLEDKNNLWIGYYYDMLVRYNFQTGHTTRIIAPNSNELNHSWGFKHLCSGVNQIIGAGDLGFLQIDTVTLQIRKIPYPQGCFNAFSLKRDSCGHYWLGSTMSRLYHFDENLTLLDEHRVTHGRFNIEDIAFPGDSSLWITLLGGGLCHYFPHSRKSEIYTTADGLSNNTTYEILTDRKGDLWISTNQGISRFTPQTKKFRIFGPSDGLQIEEFNSDAAFKAPNGEMFFGGMGGIVSFKPYEMVEPGTPTATVPLIINRLVTNGHELHFERAVYEMDTVVLNKGVNDLQFSFGALDFRYPDKIRYRYRLTGIESTWTETDHRNRIINYGNLKHGKYHFTLEATNREGEWVSHKSLLIIIPPYYYQTLGFRLFLILVALLLTGILFFHYTRQNRIKSMQKQDELRLESLRSQMNPHFVFNSLNSINYFISQNDKISANRYIADFSRLVRVIFENSTKEYVPFTIELGSIRNYLKLEHLRFGNKFDYTVEVEEGLESSSLQIYPGLVQPFLENAIWHGVRGLENRKGHILVIFSGLNSGLLRCRIEDDGIGRRLSEMRRSNISGKTSRGIGIARERLRIINNLHQSSYEITITDKYPHQEETGTVVIVDIPVKTRITADVTK